MIERFAGRFVLIQRLGRGGMGTVFLARDETTGAECALKRLESSAASLAGAAARREFEVLARIRHPAVVEVHEFGVAPEGGAYLTMEYVPGVGADRALPKRDWRSLAVFAAQVAEGMEALHAAGVVHGDLKPSNVLVLPGPGLARAGGVRLVDFGLAALVGRHSAGHTGTPGFAAPEVVRGAAPDVAADLYGLGATLYALVAGRRPFESRSVSSQLRAQQDGPPSATALEEAGLPPGFIQLILGLMAPMPHERPADARTVRRELERVCPGAHRPLAERLGTVRVVGRERELARVEAWLGATRRRAALLWIAGEPGLGSSALLDELAMRATLAGRCLIRLAPAPPEVPGALARSLLRRLAGEARAPFEEAGEVAAAWLRADEGAPAERELDALAGCAVRWARRIEGDGRAPLVLLDDTLHLDAASAALLRRIALHADANALPMVWTGARAGSGAELAAALVAAGVAEPLTLQPLSPAAIARLADARLGASAPAALSEFLARRSGGHPGLAVALLVLAAQSGAVHETDDGMFADPAALERIAAPEAFDAATLAPCRALPPAALGVAEALAVWGRPARLEELSALAPATTEHDVAALTAAGIAELDGGGRIALRAGRLAAALLGSLPAERASRLHRAVLAHAPLPARERFAHLRSVGDRLAALAAAQEAFAREPEASLAATAAELAEEAGAASAGTWHERAGAALAQLGRHAAAIPHLERALALAEPGESAAQRAVLLTTAYLRTGRFGDLARVSERALAARPSAALRARLLTNDAARRHHEGDPEGAVRSARAALEAAEESMDDESLGSAGMTLSGLLLERGQFDEARGLASRAEQWCARAGHIQNQARTRGLRGLIAQTVGSYEEAERLYRSALDLARAREARLAEEELLHNLQFLLHQTGRWAEAHALHAQAARIALEDGRPEGAVRSLVLRAVNEGLFGRPRTAWRSAQRARALAHTLMPVLEASALRAQAQALRIAGRLQRAERKARRALSRALAGSAANEPLWCRIELARALAVRGRWSAAGAVCDAGLTGPAPSDPRPRAILAALSGRALVRAATVTEARARLAEAERLLEGVTSPYGMAHLDQLRAELRMVEGRRPDAIAAAQRCLAAFASLPAPVDRALAILDLSRLALVDPAPPEAPFARWLEEAAGLFARCGDHGSRERALDQLVECHRRVAPPSHAPSHGRSLIEAVSGLLASLSDPREVARRAMTLAVEQLEAERGVLLLASPEGGALTPIAEYGAVDARLRREAITFSRRIVERVLESGDSLLVTHAPSDPRARSESVEDLRLRSIVCVPMYVGGRVIGAVYLDDSRRSDAFDEAHRSLLEGVAHLMGVALEKSRGHDEVQRDNERLVGENLALRQEVAERFQPGALIGVSTPMRRVLAIVERAAATNAYVLVTGENGTGKEMVARVLHAHGRRRHGPFVAVNCGAIPETLLEAELFGILPNVATGVRGRDGRFVQADGGTLFLDEIGEMPLSQQVALLSVLSSREITPVGGSRPVSVDVRVIAATNQDLRRRIDEGAFREDLFYRLNVIPIEVPPLREHKADIPALAHHFVAKFAAREERPAPELTPEFMAALMQSDWPGNVRELQNYIERMVAMTEGPVLKPHPLPRDLEGRAVTEHGTKRRRLTDQVEELERRLLLDALERARWNIRKAARTLGLSETAMRTRIRKYGLRPDDDAPARRRR